MTRLSRTLSFRIVPIGFPGDHFVAAPLTTKVVVTPGDHLDAVSLPLHCPDWLYG